MKTYGKIPIEKVDLSKLENEKIYHCYCNNIEAIAVGKYIRFDKTVTHVLLPTSHSDEVRSAEEILKRYDSEYYNSEFGYVRKVVISAMEEYASQFSQPSKEVSDEEIEKVGAIRFGRWILKHTIEPCCDNMGMFRWKFTNTNEFIDTKELVELYISDPYLLEKFPSVTETEKKELKDKDIEVNLIGFAYQYDVCESKEEKLSVVNTFVSNIKTLFLNQTK